MKLHDANNKAKMIKLISLLFFLLFFLTPASFAQDTNKFLSLRFDSGKNAKIKEGQASESEIFRAYYTELNSGQEFEKYSRTGPYADIVVEVCGGRLIFWRASSFLPKWETDQGSWYLDEIIERVGDGPENRPDRVNTYSHTRIGKNGEDGEEIIIHWRYSPNFSSGNPHTGLSRTQFVDEYFHIYKDGRVVRIIKPGTEKYRDWMDPDNQYVQKLLLKDEGIDEVSFERPEKSLKKKVVEGNPIKESNVGKPAFIWNFDEGSGYTTRELLSKTDCEIEGHASLWKKGISGTALQFDGYNTRVAFSDRNAPAIDNEITIEGWVALLAYPWNDAPIVNKGNNDGYFLGVTGHGYPVFKVNSGGSWTTATIPEEKEKDKKKIIDRGLYKGNLDLYTWYHLAGTYSSKDGILRLYLNGQEVATAAATWEYIDNTDESIKYTGEWKTYIRDSSGSSFNSTALGGQKVDFTFTGPKIRVIGFTQPKGGDCRIILDGEDKGTVSFYGPMKTGNQVLFESNDLGEGEHHIQLITIGETYPDAFAIWRDLKTLPKDIRTPSDDIELGQGPPAIPTDPVRASTFITQYSIDGLIDEVKIYEDALKPAQIASNYKKLKPTDYMMKNPDMEYRLLPDTDMDGFGAHYRLLDFYESWDNMFRFGEYTDVIVGFDEQPFQFVFWHGTGFVPMLVNENDQWWSNEFNETWDKSGGKGCQEPMSDKESYSNRVRIIENTEARVVVHWRYPLKDVLHTHANYVEETGWSDWSDWYYYIYPDGVAVKLMQLWTNGERNHEFIEGMAIYGPTQHPEEVIDIDPAVYLADMDGNVTAYSWADGPPDNTDYENKKIILINYKAKYKPFTIGDFSTGGVYGGEVTEYAVYPAWNHWPVAQIPSDGRYASFPDRTSHSSLTDNLVWPIYEEAYGERPDYNYRHFRGPLTISKDSSGDRPFYSKILMEGLTDKPAEELASLAKSWLNPAKLSAISGCTSNGYDKTQRAYIIEAEGDRMVLEIEASKDSPVVNPCFVVKNWKGKVAKVDVIGQQPEDIRIGYPSMVEDKDMVVWIQIQSENSVKFVIESSK